MVYACLTFPILAQSSAVQPTIQSSKKQESLSGPFLLKEQTRLVNVDVVVEDSKGNHVHGLKAEDFEVYEQTSGGC